MGAELKDIEGQPYSKHLQNQLIQPGSEAQNVMKQTPLECGVE